MDDERTRTRPAARHHAAIAALAALALSGAAVAGTSPDTVGAAELLYRDGDAWTALPTVDVAIELEITGPLVRGRLSQRFVNPTPETIEALYVFPLNDRAAVHAMEMRVGERRIVAEIREREQAQREYEAARATGRKAALVAQRRPNLFRTAVANIDPGERIDVEIEWLDEATWLDDRFTLRVPMTFTPRYDPGGPAEDARPTAPRVRLHARLRAGVPLASVASRTHPLAVEDGADGTIELEPVAGRLAGDRDLLLEWVPERGRAPAAAALVEHREEADYALVMLLPPAPDGAAGLGLRTETVFVIDVSGSMAGPSIEQAREALLAALDRLRPDDRFDLIAFDDDRRSFAGELVDASEDRVDAARRWVRGLQAEGGTMVAPALDAALAELRLGSGRTHRRAILMTDGAIGNEAEVLGRAVTAAGDVRVHTLGIGHAPNGWLIRRLAEVGRGVADFVATHEEAGNRVDAFLARLDRPVATDLEVWWDGVELDEPAPDRLPDLHAGEPLVLTARVRGRAGAGRVLVGGWTREGPLELSARLDPAAVSEPGIAVRWARRRVESLQDGLHRGADPDEVRAAVTALGLDFGIVTPHTSLVAVEVTPTALDVARRSLPVASLPAGGTDRPLRRWLGLVLAVSGAAAYGLCAWTRPR